MAQDEPLFLLRSEAGGIAHKATLHLTTSGYG